ncbi:hypothetical protein QYF61_005877 [Mycteria americana]|uniref:Rna-directed dna polymerase from mobile element jockey-like n=1 Tax=Mycteria americana TaxID=33587 RepID=A0AAN7MWF0_MYCAM|nr:hypothetical protein QYF61_005877 [Mycteria americana]
MRKDSLSQLGSPWDRCCSTLFNIFIRDLDDGIESTLTRFADGGELDTSQGRAILKRDLDRLEEWASKNCMKFKGMARLNNPRSLSRSSSDLCSRPFTSFFALLWTRSSVNVFLVAKQPQFPQPLLIRLLLQTLHQLRCPSLDTLQPLNVPLVVGGPKLNTVFKVRPHQCRVQGHDHFPSPAGHAIFDTSQDAIGFLGRLGTLLANSLAAFTLQSTTQTWRKQTGLDLPITSIQDSSTQKCRLDKEQNREVQCCQFIESQVTKGTRLFTLHAAATSQAIEQSHRTQTQGRFYFGEFISDMQKPQQLHKADQKKNVIFLLENTPAQNIRA